MCSLSYAKIRKNMRIRICHCCRVKKHILSFLTRIIGVRYSCLCRADIPSCPTMSGTNVMFYLKSVAGLG